MSSLQVLRSLAVRGNWNQDQDGNHQWKEGIHSSCSHLVRSFSETKSDCSHVREIDSQQSYLKQLVRGNRNQEQDVKHQGEQGNHSRYSHLLKCFSEKIFSLIIMSQIFIGYIQSDCSHFIEYCSQCSQM